jgi:probable addiction module antidote protein
MISKRFRYELELLGRGVTRIAGVDEAGRVIFPSGCVNNFCLALDAPLTTCSPQDTVIIRINMKKTVATRYDVAEHLRTPREMAAYLEACLEEANGDAAFIAKALGDIARAKGMARVARDAGLSRESLYKALSGDRSPSFDTILKVVEALGLSLHAKATN